MEENKNTAVSDRASVITIGGQEYELLLTTKATKEIGKKYGGLGDLGEKLMKSENFEKAIDELIWLITLWQSRKWNGLLRRLYRMGYDCEVKN